MMNRSIVARYSAWDHNFPSLSQNREHDGKWVREHCTMQRTTRYFLFRQTQFILTSIIYYSKCLLFFLGVAPSLSCWMFCSWWYLLIPDHLKVVWSCGGSVTMSKRSSRVHLQTKEKTSILQNWFVSHEKRFHDIYNVSIQFWEFRMEKNGCCLIVI